ncbi:MAG: zinc ribbon domain-containing protein [Anaerovoracaceae bacterium]
MRICSKCGTECKEEDKICSKCGSELLKFNGENEKPAAENFNSEINDIREIDKKIEEVKENISLREKIKSKGLNATKKKLSKRKLIILGIIALIIIAGIAFMIYESRQSVEKEEYISNLNELKGTALTGCASAEDLCNLTMSVWYDAIWEKNDSETNKYTDGAKDFNEALSNLYSDEEIIVEVSELMVNQEDVSKIMDKLSNPPEEYQTYYNTAMDFYSKYKTFTDLAISPDGSYQSYTDKVHELDTDVMEIYEKFETMVPSSYEK